jgi:hypothetical protein
MTDEPIRASERLKAEKAICDRPRMIVTGRLDPSPHGLRKRPDDGGVKS